MATQKQNFIEYNKSNNDTTTVWNYFLREEKGQFAKCKDEKCQKVLKTSGGNTTSLHTHLKSRHNIVLKQKLDKAAEETCGKEEKKSRIDLFFPKKDQKSLPQVLARMTALDGIPFSKFCTSLDLRAALNALGLKEKLPSSSTSIRKMVMTYAENIRQVQLEEIGIMQRKGNKFCTVFDEWTSSRNRRYLNLMLKCQSSLWNLGLIRIMGSFTSEKCLEAVESKLATLKLSLTQDVVCIGTDGTSMMTKIGRLSPTEQQLCLAHGIQLAVTDVLYRKPEQLVEPDDNNAEEALSEDEDDESSGFDEFAVERELVTVDITNMLIAPLILKTRKLVRMFRKSPLKNEKLQKYVKEDFKSELQLILDAKTRWNSLLDMLERVQLLKNCILKAQIDVAAESTLDEADFSILSEVVSALRPLKLAVEALCRRDATLLTADAALSFTNKQLDLQRTEIGLELGFAFRERVKERRTELSSVLQYLHTGKNEIKPEDTLIFTTIRKSRIAIILRDLLTRLHPERGVECVTETTNMDSEDTARDEFLRGKKQQDSLESELDKAIKQVDLLAHVENPQVSKSLLGTIKKEMGLFDAGGSRGHHLQLAYDHIKSVSPTSVESERAFSSARLLCNKVRSSLGDKTLDELLFLRSFFQFERANDM